ncbi:U3 small nucleolar RNA-associated protein 14 homolog A [Thalassophryne amazonica]|uniref:U3 small nucleolar RNA-associated protein 14 homolog A n=1 Tax=Thalassophryne amazonica TaxID=390379 RepID=UPI001470B036|nr:U3 small nucleolar RNA-associated protein 14 homolog A [Thalassophryne amazonica]
MAKVRAKKMSKKRRKAPEVIDEGAAKKPDVAYDDEEEEMNDENVTSEEEEEEDDDRKRQKLLEAISALGGKKKKKLAERSEAAVQMSEFTVNAEGEGDKIDLSELIGTMQKTPAVSAKTKKQLKHLQQSKTIECPLSRQESERIHRDLAFKKVANEVDKWKSIIRQNQKAEQLFFPLNQEPSGPKPMEAVVSGWKARTPLEQEIFALLSANKQPLHDPILTSAEEASLKAMSLEEAKIRRAELQKARALQSYYEAKARREKKIKSKKYHRVHNKAKRKDFLRAFDEMVKTDPASALEELNKMEVARMQERMSLKHQNSGKWAKSKAVMAKYDEAARKAMQEQLEVNKELTQKLVTPLNNEEEEEETGGGGADEMLHGFVNDAETGGNSANPWMRGKLSAEPAEENPDEGTDLTEEPPLGAGKAVEEEEEEMKETEEETLLKEFDSRRKLRQGQECDEAAVITLSKEDDEESARRDTERPNEEEELSEFTSLYRGIADGHQVVRDDDGHVDSSAQLEGSLTRIRTLEDMELITQEEVEESVTDNAPQQAAVTEDQLPNSQKVNTTKKRKRGIKLKDVLTKQAKVINVPLGPTVEDAEDSDENQDQRGLIREAFAGDDIVSDFLKDKRKQEDAGKPKVLDLTLPGWGEWAGIGLKPSRKKRKRFRIKVASPPPRKDQHLPAVIISEKRNSSVSLNQVSSLPFPFQSSEQFESTIRCPLSRTWNTEQTVLKLTKPKVVTQLGAIIEPITREELVKKASQGAAGYTPKPNR